MDACSNVENQLVGKAIRACFVHDFVSVVFDTRKSCGWRHFSTKRTVMRPLRGQNFLRGSQPLKYCFDLYSSRLYLENLVLTLRPS